ncbi:MAG TPA: HAMP domain-containing sensor histidine kinase [Mobilitalea sp.]|nr:HAMP domain-containing sensor histidine kinase [Mobilitalea sp.]
MRLKLILLISTICLILIFVFTQNHISSQEYKTIDIIDLNDTYKNIVKELQSRPIEEVERAYSCNILMESDNNYSNELNSAIVKGNIILDFREGDRIIGKIIFTANSDLFLQMKDNLSIALWTLFSLLLILIYIVTFIVNRRLLRPFRQLEQFADHIATGNLDIPMIIEKANYFGAFTESFDMMREEIKKARQGEYDANISKKELVAELSHDIKTPVSVIKALCEILEIKLQEEEVLTKIQTINQKADVIDKLISNMFHATLEELEVLRIEPREELSTIISPMFMELNHYGKIHMKNEVPGCLIYCDKLRLNQVIDNIINNAYKYANTDIDVTYFEDEDCISVKIKDYGSSILDNEIPLVFGKFYRGKNTITHSGSGLGLYLAKQFMEGMGGGIECLVEDGFVIVLKIKKV